MGSEMCIRDRTGTVDVGQGGNTITNITTAATGDQPDPFTAGDDLDEAVTVEADADLVTVKTLGSGDSTPAEGDTVSFDIEVTNNGTAQATNVSLTDSLPAGITFVSSSVTQGSYNSTTGLFTIGTLNAGSSATLTLTGTVDVGQGGNTITNITTAAAGDQPDPSTAGDDLDEAVTVEDDADLVTVKTLASGDNTPAEGDTVSFAIEVTNGGTAQATNVSLIDSLPAGITFVSSSVTQGSYNSATGLFTIGTLNAGSTATLTLTGTVDVGQGGNTITNITTAAAGDQPDPSTAGDDLDEAVNVEADADLVTVKTLASGDNTPVEGDTVSFAIEVTNNGTAQATNVSLTDSLPAGITFVSSSVTQGSYNSATGLFTIGTLNAGSSAILTLTGTVDVGQGGNTITNITTAAAGDQPDPSTAGDDLVEAVNVEEDADLVTIKTLASGDSTPDEGDTVSFEIEVTNNGTAQATNVSLIDTLPAGITFVTSSVSQGTYNSTTGLFTIGTLNAGATATLTLTGTVDVGQGGNTITNVTTAAMGDQPDPSTAGDDLVESVTVNDAADLVTVKTLASGNATPQEGEAVTFQIVVTNNGAAQATNVSLTDQLPAGITYTSDTTSQGSYNPATGLWTIGTLNSGATATITLTGTVDVGQGGNTITNVTTAATGDQMDPSTVGDDLDEAVVVDNTTDLVTVKTLASGTAAVDEGDTVTFDITVTNSGPAFATNVSLTDLLPAGLTATSFNGGITQGTYNATTGLWTIGNLAVGQTATLTLQGTVDVGQAGNVITNITTAATGDQTDPSTVGDDLEEFVSVGIPAADLVTVKTLASGDATPDEGDVVTFDITVTNNGPDTATNVSLVDLLPAGLTVTADNGTVSQGTYNATTGLFNIGTLASGATATLTLEGTVDIGQGGNTITNVTTAAMGDQVDPSTVGDDLDETINVGLEDKDWDGIADSIDLDADNDGILDADETAYQFVDVQSLGISANTVGASGSTDISSLYGLSAGSVILNYTNLNTNVNGPLTVSSTQSTQFTITGTEPVLIRVSHGSNLSPGGSDGIVSLDGAIYNFTGTLENGYTQNNSGATYLVDAGPAADGNNSGGLVWESVGPATSVEVVTTNTPNLNNNYRLVIGVAVPDTDGDGVHNECDFDSDNDGISDLVESGNILAIAADTNQDGTISVAEANAAGFTDANGDGAWDQLGAPPVDTDGDGIADYLDLDSDNDGIPDAVEAQPTAGYQTPAIGSDADGDGVVDTFDDPSVDHGGAFTTPEDTDGDGTPDYLDTDSDNDGIDDTTESGLMPGPDFDGDGIADNVAPNSYNDTDGIISDTASDLEDVDNNTSDVDFRSVVLEADLVTVKTLASGDNTPAEGDTVTFQIEVTNNGSGQATNVSLIDSLPAGITFTSSTTSLGTYNASAGVWTIGTLNNGASATLTLTGTVDVGQGGNTITNTTTAAMGDQPDPSTAGDDLDETVNVEADADLVTIKTLASGDNTPAEGGTVSFAIEVTNNGTAQATNVSLIDSLPAGISFVSSSVTQGTYNATTGLFTIGTLNAGGTATLTLTGTVDVGQGGNTITNTTTAAMGDQPDPSTAGDDLVEAVNVEADADLVTVKTLASGDSTPAEGDTVSFEIEVTNNGTAQATNVSLIDSLPGASLLFPVPLHRERTTRPRDCLRSER